MIQKLSYLIERGEDLSVRVHKDTAPQQRKRKESKAATKADIYTQDWRDLEGFLKPRKKERLWRRKGMNRGVLQLQSSPIMAAGNPNWPWNINGTGIRSPQPLSPLLGASAPTSSFLFGQYYAPTSVPLPFAPSSWSDLYQDFPESMSLSQLMIM